METTAYEVNTERGIAQSSEAQEDPGTGQLPPDPSEIEVDYLADAPERSLKVIADAAARQGENLKLRTSLQLWNPDAGLHGAYRGWRGQSWILNLKGVEDAKRVQQIMLAVFDLIEVAGAEKVLEAMKTLKDDQTPE